MRVLGAADQDSVSRSQGGLKPTDWLRLFAIEISD